MSSPRMTVLVVGAPGSIGRIVEEEAIRKGHAVRALIPEKQAEPQRVRHDLETMSRQS